MLLRLLAICCLFAVPARAGVDVTVGYLRVAVERPSTLSELDVTPESLGIDGARLGIADNATTGRFTGQDHALRVTDLPPGGDALAAARALLADSPLLVVDAPADTLLAIADLPEAAGALILNAGAPEPRLRDADCRANLLHSLPSTDMRTDALAQFFVARRWRDLVMIAGTWPEDVAFAQAMTRSLAKFGLDLAAAKTWAFDADMRRNAAQEVPLFTQDFGDYDALIVADEVHDFGRYILYNTWLPRPVTGSEGLAPVAWAPVVEQWGALQLQNRFTDLAGRPMQPTDYAAWAAVRAIGEAATRTGAADAATLRDFLLSDAFELAAFKGAPLTFRRWNGQLRQPIPLVHPRALVDQAPIEGFLHQVSELDTLGTDEPESQCKAFR